MGNGARLHAKGEARRRARVLEHLDDRIDERAPPQMWLDPGEEQEVAVRALGARNREAIRRPVEDTSQALVARARALHGEVVVRLGKDLSERLRVPLLSDVLHRGCGSAVRVRPAGEAADEDRIAEWSDLIQ